MSQVQLKVGDKVTIHAGHKYHKPQEAEVTKVGRVYYYVTNSHGRTEPFHKETFKLKGEWGYTTWIETPEITARKERELAASEYLREYGIRFDFRTKVSLELMEDLAAAVRKHEGVAA